MDPLAEDNHLEKIENARDDSDRDAEIHDNNSGHHKFQLELRHGTPPLIVSKRKYPRAHYQEKIRTDYKHDYLTSTNFLPVRVQMYSRRASSFSSLVNS
jgi:hypothetical protein